MQVIVWLVIATLAATLMHGCSDGSNSTTTSVITVDPTIVADEVACQKNISTPGYFSSLNGAEVADAQRSQLYPCAVFLGSWQGPTFNTVTQSAQFNYLGAGYINNREPGQVYLVGGMQPPPTPANAAAGPFVAQVNSSTGAPIWQTVLSSAANNQDGHWVGPTNLNILSDGNIVEAWSNQIALLDPSTGAILKQVTLPANLPGGIDNTLDGSFKDVTIAPDGTIILKQQSRPYNCPIQGVGALISCAGAGDGPTVQANSMLVAVNPQTLQIYDAVLMPEMAVAPHTITTFNSQFVIYAGGSNRNLQRAYRYIWNPTTKKLSQDASWTNQPDKTFGVSFLQAGQYTSAAPGFLGNWVLIQTNGGIAQVQSSVVAINQSTPNNQQFNTPFPISQFPIPPSNTNPPNTGSWAPPKTAIDTDNNMVYSNDVGVGGIAGLKFNPTTGELTTVFTLQYQTAALQSLIGPANQRVLVTTKHSSYSPDLFGTNYTEQVMWLDAATGRTLAQSSALPPMTANSLVTPAFGGGFYYLTPSGLIYLSISPN